MKGLTASIIFIHIFVHAYGCKLEWDPTCKTDKDCCSKKCFKELTWENGFCVAGKTEPPRFDKCQADYFDRCIVNEHCCSKLCNRSPYDQFGTCTPKAAVVPAPANGTIVATCENDWVECASHAQCCSGICEKNGSQKIGACKPKAAQVPQAPQCLPDWSDRCGRNEDCCSRYCDRSKSPNSKFGRCTSAAATPAPVQPQPSPPRQCQNDWSTQCAAHNQCCSGFCEKLGNQRLGTCKPTQPTQPPQGNQCAYDGSNQCLYNEDCCSGICDKSQGQYYGICRPRPVVPAKRCEIDWYSPCKDNAQCCSNFCKKTGGQQSGVCNPAAIPRPASAPAQAPAQYPNPTPGPVPGSYPYPQPPNTRCENDWFNQCTNHNQCCSGFCKMEGNWKYGVCTPSTASALPSGQVPVQTPGQAQPSYPTNGQCQRDYFNQCTSHNQCCSGYCETEGNWKYGVCKPISQRPAEPPKVNICSPDWSNQCISNNDCCSGFCEMNLQYNVGTCKPQNDIAPEVNYRNIQGNQNVKNAGIQNTPAKNCGNKKVGCT